MHPDIIRQHLAYNAWATNRLLAACATLRPDRLNQDFGTADKSIAGTLLHLFRAERVWLKRILRVPSPAFAEPGDSWASVQADWPDLQTKWQAWAAQTSEQELVAEMRYSDLTGNPRSNKLWESVFHMVNHGSHHRGQVSAFLRSLGTTPPMLDYIGYVREIS